MLGPRRTDRHAGPSGHTRRLVTAALALVFVFGGMAGPPSRCWAQDRFVASNARRHIAALAETFGSRPIGTAAHAAARAYLVDQLRQIGFAVRVQVADVVRPQTGVTTHVLNVIATETGAVPDARGLVAHYDSVPDGPGAADDAFGTAVVLEAARVLAARPRRHYSLMVLLTDGEEAGLIGATALLDDPAVIGRLRAYANIESIGTRGPAPLFETGPYNGALLHAWARHAPYPRGASFALDIYKRLPNDTDFSVLRQAGIPGLNFALVGNSYAYHTARDTAGRIPDRAIQHTGDNLVAIMDALDRTDLARPPPDQPRYFDIAGMTAVSYGRTTGRVLFLAAVGFGAFAWWRIVMMTLMLAGLRRMLWSMFWITVGVLLAAGAMVGVTWLLRAIREVQHPWYAHPDRLLLLLITAGALTGALVAEIAARPGWRGCVHPAVIWCLTLPVWIGLAGIAEWWAPAASFLWTVPLLAAGATLVACSGWHPGSFRIGSIVALVVTATLWLRDAVLLYGFLVTVLGREPIVTPVWVYPALLLAAGVMLVPPLVLVTGVLTYERPLLGRPAGTAIAGLAFLLAAGFAVVAPAYTEARPLRRHVRYLQDDAAGVATWEIGSNEPSRGVVRDGQSLAWRADGDPPALSVPVQPFNHPFVFRAAARKRTSPPASLSATLVPGERTVDLAIRVMPATGGNTVGFVLPVEAAPVTASLAGVSVPGSGWTASYRPVPAGGLTFTASVPAGQANAVRRGSVILETFHLPGGAGRYHLPPWLVQDRSVWQVLATFVISIAALLESDNGRPFPPASSAPPAPRHAPDASQAASNLAWR